MILDELLDSTRALVAERRAALPAEALRAKLNELPLTQEVISRLHGPGVAVIAEVKRASPSKGALNLALDPAALAVSYARAGAAMISVLTEPTRFHGSPEDLCRVKRALGEADLTIPVLRKDFIVDDYQLLEARVWGADAVLLIAAALDDATLARLPRQAEALGLTPLVEVHNEQELARVLPSSPRLIGINNRDLRDFHTDLAVTRRLRPLIPPTCTVISESGIHAPEQMRELAALGVHAALVGEALVTAPDPCAKLQALWEAGCR